MLYVVERHHRAWMNAVLILAAEQKCECIREQTFECTQILDLPWSRKDYINSLCKPWCHRGLMGISDGAPFSRVGPRTACVCGSTWGSSSPCKITFSQVSLFPASSADHILLSLCFAAALVYIR